MRDIVPSHSTASMERWLVGSSSSRMSGSAARCTVKASQYLLLPYMLYERERPYENQGLSGAVNTCKQPSGQCDPHPPAATECLREASPARPLPVRYSIRTHRVCISQLTGRGAAAASGMI